MAFVCGVVEQSVLTECADNPPTTLLLPLLSPLILVHRLQRYQLSPVKACNVPTTRYSVKEYCE